MKKIFSKNSFSWILWAFFYFFIFTLLLKGSFGYLDPDLGWHLKIGEEIARTGSMPNVNSYNYTFTGTWVDHEWLSNFLVYEIYSHWGYIALSVLFALLIVSILIVLNIWARRACSQASSFFIAFFQLLGVVASLPHLGVRIQEIGLLFLLLILLIIYHYNKCRNWKLLLVLMPIMYLWSCLHGSFIIGLIILFAWIGIKILEKILRRYYNKAWLDFSRVLEWREILIFFGMALLSAIATLLTPYGLKLYSFLNGYKDNFYAWHIQEWLPQFQYPFQYQQLFYLALVVAALILYWYYSRGNKRYWRIDLWTLFLTALFIFLSFKSHRHFPLMFVAAFIFIIDIFSRLLPVRSEKTDSEKSWSEKNWLKWYLLACLFLAAASQFIMTDFTSDPFLSFRRSYPVGAVDFLKEQPQYDSVRLFNEYAWGGYLIWRMPARLIFIDGRLPQVEYQGKTFLEEYLEFFNRDTDIPKKMADYDIGLVLIPARDEKIKAKRWEQILFGISDKNLTSHNYLRDYLAGSGDWQPIYYDRTSIIYKRIK